jgi:hypothetical protein
MLTTVIIVLRQFYYGTILVGVHNMGRKRNPTAKVENFEEGLLQNSVTYAFLFPIFLKAHFFPSFSF